MRKIIIIASLMTSLLLADAPAAKSQCLLNQEGAVTVNWKAYKTAEKLGVGGTFNDVKFSGASSDAKDLKALLVGSTALIDTATVNSKHPERDTKLVNSFFKILKDPKITAKVIDVTETGTLKTEITLGGVTKNVPMKYTFLEGALKAEGFIDLFDFEASGALSSINKACYDLHQGKTWNDVAISFETKISSKDCGQ